jgi:hypothetical protein
MQHHGMYAAQAKCLNHRMIRTPAVHKLLCTLAISSKLAVLEIQF